MCHIDSPGKIWQLKHVICNSFPLTVLYCSKLNHCAKTICPINHQRLHRSSRFKKKKEHNAYASLVFPLWRNFQRTWNNERFYFHLISQDCTIITPVYKRLLKWSIMSLPHCFSKANLGSGGKEEKIVDRYIALMRMTL